MTHTVRDEQSGIRMRWISDVEYIGTLRDDGFFTSATLAIAHARLHDYAVARNRVLRERQLATWTKGYARAVMANGWTVEFGWKYAGMTDAVGMR